MSSSGGASPGEGGAGGGQEPPAAAEGQAVAGEAAVDAAAAAAVEAPIPASLLTPGMALSAALGQEGAAGAESEQDMGRLQVVDNTEDDTVNTVRRPTEGQSP